jgi:hypothetical protein
VTDSAPYLYDGQAAAATSLLAALSADERLELVSFLRTLRAP